MVFAVGVVTKKRRFDPVFQVIFDTPPAAVKLAFCQVHITDAPKMTNVG